MKALRSFTVRPSLPSQLGALEALADEPAVGVGRPDPRSLPLGRPRAVGRPASNDPMHLLGLVGRERLDSLAADPGFMRFLDEVFTELTAISRSRAGSKPARTARRFVALRTSRRSSGSPKRCRSTRAASVCSPAITSRRVPISAFRSSASGCSTATGTSARSCRSTGGSRSAIPTSTRTRWPSRDAKETRIQVDLAGQRLIAQVWRADVGRVPLYLLDADVDENPDDMRQVTDRLYGGRRRASLAPGDPPRHRRCARAASTRCSDARCFHNQRRATRVSSGSNAFVRPSSNRACRTPRRSRPCGPRRSSRPTRPCPRGSTAFPPELIEKYFSGWAAECGLSVPQLMNLGHRLGDPPTERFQHGGDGPPARGPLERGCRSCTATSAARCSAICGPMCRPRRSPSPR